MQDWEVTNKRIYQLLKHPYQVDKSIVEDMTTAYLEFVEELFSYLNEGKDNKNIIRKLNTTHIEFATIKAFEEALPTENNKLKIVFLDKLITLVEKELELLYRLLREKYRYNAKWLSYHIGSKMASIVIFNCMSAIK